MRKSLFFRFIEAHTWKLHLLSEKTHTNTKWTSLPWLLCEYYFWMFDRLFEKKKKPKGRLQSLLVLTPMTSLSGEGTRTAKCQTSNSVLRFAWRSHQHHILYQTSITPKENSLQYIYNFVLPTRWVIASKQKQIQCS